MKWQNDQLFRAFRVSKQMDFWILDLSYSMYIIQCYWTNFNIIQQYSTINIIQCYFILQHKIIQHYSTFFKIIHWILFNIVERKPPRLLGSHMNYSMGSPLPTKCLTFDLTDVDQTISSDLKIGMSPTDKQTNKQTKKQAINRGLHFKINVWHLIS